MALRIKDNVDLKELEKFGFEYSPDYNLYYKDKENWFCDKEIKIGEDRIIRMWSCYETEDDSYAGDSELEDDEVYEIDDLIKADLVEKVGE